jgi:hypothetical protein
MMARILSLALVFAALAASVEDVAKDVANLSGDGGTEAVLSIGEDIGAAPKLSDVGTPKGLTAYWSFDDDYNDGIASSKGQTALLGKKTGSVGISKKAQVGGGAQFANGEGRVTLGIARKGSRFDSLSHTWTMWLKLGTAGVGPLTAFAATIQGKKTPWAFFGKGQGDTVSDGVTSIIPTFDHGLPKAGEGAVVSTSSKVRANGAGVTSTTTVTTVYPTKAGFRSVVQTTASAPRLSARGTWYHLASVREAGKSKMYVNGNLVAETFQVTGLSGEALITIGGMEGEDRKNGFIGEVDELAFFNRALGREEVKRVYDIGKKGDPLFKNYCDLKGKAPKHGHLGTCEYETNMKLRSGTTCKPGCNKGYSLDKELKCYDGVLSEAKCIGTPCRLPKEADGVLNGDCPKEMKSGSVCRPKCKPGYSMTVKQDVTSKMAKATGLLVAKGQRACVAGNLQGVTCEFTGCEQVSVPKNGGRGDCPLSHMNDGTSCTPTCKAGYMLKQKFNAQGKLTSKASCTNKKFTGSECEQRPCFGMDDPPHGVTGQCPKRGKGSKPVKHSCKYYCDAGYMPKGDAICSEGIYKNVKCIPKTCKFEAPVNGGAGDCPAVMKSGTRCTPSCNKGYSRLPKAQKGSKAYKFLGLTECEAGGITKSKCGPNDCLVDTYVRNGNVGTCPVKLKHGQSCSPVCDEWYKKSASQISCETGEYTPVTCDPDPWVTHGKCTTSKDKKRKGLKMTCSKVDDVFYKVNLKAENMDGVIFKSVIPNGGTHLLGTCQRYTCLGVDKVEIRNFKTKDCTGKYTTETRAAPFTHPPGEDGMRLSGNCEVLDKTGKAKLKKVKVAWHDAADATTGSCALSRELNEMTGFEDYIADECVTVFNPNTAEVDYVKYSCDGDPGPTGRVGYTTFKDASCRFDGLARKGGQRSEVGGSMALQKDALLVPLNDEK